MPGQASTPTSAPLVEVSFFLPFSRRDLWRELTQRATDQLGTDPKSTTLSVLQKGTGAEADELCIGLVRIVMTNAGEATTSRLMAGTCASFPTNHAASSLS